jgi:hypothetical protein
MKADVLKPNEYIIVSVDVTGRRPRIYYKVLSTHNVKVYLLDSEGVKNFENGNEFDTYNDIHSRKYHEDGILLPDKGTWYLVVDNSTNKEVMVSYEVYI